jgi:hypothetical protein
MTTKNIIKAKMLIPIKKYKQNLLKRIILNIKIRGRSKTGGPIIQI